MTFTILDWKGKKVEVNTRDLGIFAGVLEDVFKEYIVLKKPDDKLIIINYNQMMTIQLLEV